MVNIVRIGLTTSHDAHTAHLLDVLDAVVGAIGGRDHIAIGIGQFVETLLDQQSYLHKQSID